VLGSASSAHLVLGTINAGLDPFLFLLRWHTGQHWGFCSARFDGGDGYQSGIHTAGTSVHRPLGLVFEQKINVGMRSNGATDSQLSGLGIAAFISSMKKSVT
jgi:hypothetical protein